MNMDRLRFGAAISLLSSLWLCACASTPAVRTLASNTGVFVQSLTDGTSDFVQAQNRLNAQNEARLVRLDGYGARARAQVRQQRLVWTDMGSSSRLATHDLATQTPATEILAGMTVVQRQPSRIENGTEAGYRATLAALANVSTTPKPFSAIAELLEFGQQVQESYNELRDAAAAAASDAAAASTVADQHGVASGSAATAPPNELRS
jgi:hypothetical protein